MKKNKNILPAIMITTILLGSMKVNALNDRTITLNSDKYEITTKKLIEQYGENYKTYFNNVEKATENGQKLQKALFDEQSDINTYPNYIGGSYIDDEGNFTIQIVESNLPRQKSSRDFIYDNIYNLDSVKIEYVDNTYNELNEVNDKIINYFLQNKNNLGLIANFVDVNKNAVIVELEDLSEEIIDSFKKNIVDSSTIQFVKGLKNTRTANLNPGQKEESINCTVGFRAKLNNKEGYVTAGHCVKNRAIGSVINTGTIRKVKVDSTLDAAFIETFSSRTPTNTLNTPIGSVTALNVKINPFYQTSAPVAKVGGVTGGHTGKIKSLNWSGTVGKEYVTNMISTDIYNYEGDSGAPVFLYKYGMNGDLIGNSFGGYNGGNHAVVNPLQRIIDEFGITRY